MIDLKIKDKNSKLDKTHDILDDILSSEFITEMCRSFAVNLRLFVHG